MLRLVEIVTRISNAKKDIAAHFCENVFRLKITNASCQLETVILLVGMGLDHQSFPNVNVTISVFQMGMITKINGFHQHAKIKV